MNTALKIQKDKIFNETSFYSDKPKMAKNGQILQNSQ